MDTVTHGIIGALIGKAFFAGESPIRSWREPPKTADRVAVLAATLGAVFPDVDTLAGPIAHNSLAIMTWHRGITHSLVLLPVWAIGLAVLTRGVAGRLRWPSPTLSLLFLIYVIGLGSHVFLDVITSFGTMIWSPINHDRYAWDWLFIIDLTLTSLALVPQLAAWAFENPKMAGRRAVPLWAVFSGAAFALIPITRSLDVPYSLTAALVATAGFALFFLSPLLRQAETRLNRPKYCRAGLALVSLYIVFAGTMHHMALGYVASAAKQSGIRSREIAAIPLPPSPNRWAGLIAAPGGLYRLELNETSDQPVAFQYFPQARPNQYIVAANALRDVQVFNWFARFPLTQFSETDGMPVVLISAMSFYRGREQQGTDGEMTNFTYRIVFSPDARVLSHGWVRPE
jgi:membrane-bound metal-dependent hydrolase YbcI (DUF457 family)